MLTSFLFIFGLSVGSFINVLGLRYKEGGRIFSLASFSGRSLCPKCKKKLAWYELIPLLSFFIQGARCKSCKKSISWQYPAIELLTGLLTVLIVFRLSSFFHLRSLLHQGVNVSPIYLFIGLWLLLAYSLILMSIIDLRFHIIPDQLNIFLAGLGILVLFLKSQFALLFPFQGSFLFSYQDLFSLSSNVLLSAIFSAIIAGAGFFLIILLSKGKGMGMGDAKLMIALGLLMGWPDIFLVMLLSFVIGSIYSIPLILFTKKSIKSAVPFGPFIAGAVFATILLGESIISWYFKLL